MSAYPEHDKLDAIRPRNEVIGDFLAWLERQGERICWYDEEHQSFEPIHRSVEAWLAVYFDIDVQQLEREKRAMLAALRSGADS